MTNDITIIEKDITPIEKKAIALEITDSKGMEIASEMLSQVNKVSDNIEGEREKVTKPLNEALKAERARWKPAELICDRVIALLRGKMSKYQTEALRLQKIEEAKIEARIKEGKGNLKLETAVKKIDALDKPEAKVVVASGSVAFRPVNVLIIFSEKDIPREYLVPDESLIKKSLLEGKVVTGARIDVEQVPVNRR